MKYRHAFHAGNFADVHKHVALCALLQAMQRKDTGLFYLDTHAGAGCYDLAAANSHRGAEARHGVTPVLAAAGRLGAPELQHYCGLIRALRTQGGRPMAYPGSPWLAARLLRPQDRGLCCEWLPSECRALERALGGMRRMRTACADGYGQLRAVLPPRERRALVLIDPPYEEPGAELERALAAIGIVLERLANAVIALWYPIKDERALAPWLRRVAQQLQAPTLDLELWIHARDSRVGLNGSGLLVVNPPFQFEQDARTWQQELLVELDPAGRGGSSTRMLVGEADLSHVGA
ncbi:MAG TPA: 23S rRNA (adenine(2030)-N(6))-methyltransferase RlmJ [Steroidobacteraceae bacterium]|nr:23S rRNA (adenine(2030)-N(6))-methyltransferase RlmJ [Steroidobacteraceae bacterium]